MQSRFSVILQQHQCNIQRRFSWQHGSTNMQWWILFKWLYCAKHNSYLYSERWYELSISEECFLDKSLYNKSYVHWSVLSLHTFHHASLIAVLQFINYCMFPSLDAGSKMYSVPRPGNQHKELSFLLKTKMVMLSSTLHVKIIQVLLLLNLNISVLGVFCSINSSFAYM